MRTLFISGLVGASMLLSGCGMLVASILDENERASRASASSSTTAKSNLSGTNTFPAMSAKGGVAVNNKTTAATTQTKEQLCAQLEIEHRDESLVLFRRKLMNGCFY